MGKKTKRFLFVRIRVGLLMFLGLSLTGCGVKGPPVPLRQSTVPVVTYLSHTLSDDIATLTWSLSAPLSEKGTKDAAFGLYRSLTPLESEPCDNCPQIFEKALTIPYVDRADNRYDTKVRLEPGYRYLFKIRLETRVGTGADSDVVRFDFPSTADSENLENQ